MKSITSILPFLFLAVFSSRAAIPTDSIGEGTIAGFIPVAADTVNDTSFHPGDTLILESGDVIVKPHSWERQEAAIPSVKTQLGIMVGDGFAQGRVVQTFRNPFNLPFEATYIFPLPNQGAVHAMEFRTSGGVYRARILEKEEAKEQYEQAKQEGKQAALLLQGQDNIFVQKLCNIAPHDSVVVAITFSMPLHYDMGEYELAFPTVVGPRYDPAPLPKRQSNPSYLPPESRSGSTLDFTVLILTPWETDNLHCASHDILIESEIGILTDDIMPILNPADQPPSGLNMKLIRLKPADSIPNKDIVIRFGRKSAERNISVLSWHDGSRGYFAMNVFPDERDTIEGEPLAIDMVFVLDVSGSMGGQPIAKLKEIMHTMLDRARSRDRLSFIAFSSSTSNFHEDPVHATPENIEAAHVWIDNLYASGGTEMLSGVRQGLAVPLEPGRQRIMTLITDGYIGNIAGIYQAIENDPCGTIAFTFGVGSSVNRELLDAAAAAGDGIATAVLLDDDVTPIVDGFWKRIRTPQLSDISLDWGGTVSDLTLHPIPALWLGQPLLLFGRYTGGGERTITLSGMRGNEPVSEQYHIRLVENNTCIDGVPKMWARRIIENLRNEQQADGSEINKERILEISLAFGVLCEYTAFLAVADSIVNENGEMVAAGIPVPVPEGVDGDMAGAEYAIGIDRQPETAPRVSLESILFKLNLTMHATMLQIRLSGFPMENLDGSLKIFDVTGRLIRSWTLAELARNGFVLAWRFDDTYGQAVARGMYVIHLESPAVNVSRAFCFR